MVFYIILVFAIITMDLLVKLWAQNTLMDIGTIPIIKDIFHLTYAENRGAAFSILEGNGGDLQSN